MIKNLFCLHELPKPFILLQHHVYAEFITAFFQPQCNNRNMQFMKVFK